METGIEQSLTPVLGSNGPGNGRLRPGHVVLRAPQGFSYSAIDHRERISMDGAYSFIPQACWG